MKGLRNDVMSFAGSLKDADLDSVEKMRKDIREDWDER
jgi:ABC-type sulfate transport system substrate-binding protein